MNTLNICFKGGIYKVFKYVNTLYVAWKYSSFELKILWTSRERERERKQRKPKKRIKWLNLEPNQFIIWLTRMKNYCKFCLALHWSSCSQFIVCAPESIWIVYFELIILIQRNRTTIKRIETMPKIIIAFIKKTVFFSLLLLLLLLVLSSKL